MRNQLPSALLAAVALGACAPTDSGCGPEPLSVSVATAAPSGLHEVFVYALGME